MGSSRRRKIKNIWIWNIGSESETYPQFRNSQHIPEQ